MSMKVDSQRSDANYCYDVDFILINMLENFDVLLFQKINDQL